MHEPTPGPTPRRLLDVALAASEEAAARALRWFRDPPRTETKGDGTVVTAADRECESILRAAIRREFPDHAILGEEGTDEPGAAPYRWILDPIDGTESFVRGVPLWGMLVAVEAHGEPVVGVCRMPAIGETVAAARGEGCAWNGWPCRVSDVADLSRACAAVTSPRANRRRTAHYLELEESVMRVRGWSDCYAYVLVATGRVDLAVDPVMKPWDCGPFVTILEEAGGRFTDWSGRRTIHGGDAVASNGLLHDAALAVLGGVSAGRGPGGTPRPSA